MSTPPPKPSFATIGAIDATTSPSRPRIPAAGRSWPTADDAIVGTGIATISGSAAWIGTIWVDPRFRGGGLGMALTQTTIDAAEAEGCRTLILVATDAGRRLYEKIGFEVQTTYRIVEAPGLARARPDPRVRAFRTGRPRGDGRPLTGRRPARIDAHSIEAFATPETTRCLDRPDGTLGGFVIRAPWGGGATIAPDPDDAAAILQARRTRRRVPTSTSAPACWPKTTAGLERLAQRGLDRGLARTPDDPRRPAGLGSGRDLGPVQPRDGLRAPSAGRSASPSLIRGLEPPPAFVGPGRDGPDRGRRSCGT